MGPKANWPCTEFRKTIRTAGRNLKKILWPIQDFFVFQVGEIDGIFWTKEHALRFGKRFIARSICAVNQRKMPDCATMLSAKRLQNRHQHSHKFPHVLREKTATIRIGIVEYFFR